MDKQSETLGYVACSTCLTPKAIKQCNGKRSAFVMGNCECGADQRTGKAAQAEMNRFKPLEQVQSELEVLKAPAPLVVSEPLETQTPDPIKPNEQTQSKPLETENAEPKPMSTAACVGVGALVGLVFGGIIKTIKAVA